MISPLYPIKLCDKGDFMIKLILVDDDQINSKIFSKRLQKRGYHTEVFNSGTEFLEFFEKEGSVSHYIIILDIVMPNKDGVAVLKALREKYSPMELPVIMMSANEDTEKVVECLNVGASDYLTKPANIDIAVARIKTQWELIKYHEGNVKKKQLETINSMVTTFNHEINNPLTIALGSLRRDFSKIDEKRVKIAVDALERIATIVKKIERITKSGSVEEDTYIAGTKMIKIK